MNSSVNIIVVQGKEVVAAAEGTANNAPARLKAQSGAKYLLAAGKEGKPAPLDGNVIVKRNGKNLEIFADDNDSRPEFIIEDYFSQPGDIAALGSDGQYHLLVAEQTESSAFLLDDGATLALMPGSALTGLTGLAVAAGISTGWLIAGGIAGLLALGGIAAAAGGGGGGGGESGNGGSDETPVPAPAPVDISSVLISDNVGSVQGPVAPGGVTDDARVLLAGNGTPGSVIRIYDNGQLIGSTVIDGAGRWSWQPEQALAAGSHELTFSEVNPAGEEGPQSAGVSFELDLTAPGRVEDFTLTDKVGSSHGPVQPGDTFNDTRPVFSGRAEPGATVEIRDNGELIGSALVGSDGVWSWQPDTDFTDGEHNFSVIVVDPAGNSGLPVEFGSVIIDSGLVDIPAFDSITDNKGRELADGDATNANPLRLGGEGQPGDIVTVIVDGEAVGSVIVGEDGNWSYELVLPNEGNFDVGFTVTNPEGEEVGRSDPIELIYDTTAPDAPVMGNVTDGEGNPVVSGDSNVKNPIFSGSGANPGDTVWLYDGPDRIGSTVVDENGDWTLTSPELEEGSHDLSLRFEDAAGNLSDASDSLNLESDFTAPAAPVMGDVTDGQGNPVEAGASNVKNPIFSGDNAAPGDIVYLYDGVNNPVASTVVGADGKWQIVSPDLSEGPHDLNLRFEDAAGNLSEPSDNLHLESDFTAPAAPVLGDVKDSEGNPVLPGASNVKSPVFSGDSAPPGDIVYLYDGENNPIASVVVGADGTWQIVSPELSEGPHDLNLRFEDAAGNLSDASDNLHLESDFTAPAAPVLGDVVDANGNLVEAGASNVKNPIFSGDNAAPGDIVYLYDGENNPVASTIVGADGKWQIESPDLDEGAHDLSLRFEDAAGNLSDASDSLELDIDLTAPDAPDISSVVLSDKNGNELTAGDATNTEQPKFSGTGTSGDTVYLYDGADNVIGSATVGQDGSWSIISNELDDGSYDFYLRYEDAVGNMSDSSATVSLIVDTKAPDAVSFGSVEDDLGNPVAMDSFTNSTRPVFTGTGEAGTIVYLVNDLTGQQLGSALVDEFGNWSIQEDLSDDTLSLRLDAVDKAGNQTTGSDKFGLTIDTQAPGAAQDITFSDKPLALSGAAGSAEEDAWVFIRIDGNDVASVQVNADGSWSWTSASDMSDGNYQLDVVVGDQAGNRSPASDVINYAVSTSAYTFDTGLEGWTLGSEYAADPAYNYWNNGHVEFNTLKDVNPGETMYLEFSVTAGMTYSFSFDGWGLSALNAASLGIAVDGTLLNGYTTMQNGVTQTISGEWIANSTGTIRIAIMNASGGSTGNDFAIDNVSVRESGVNDDAALLPFSYEQTSDFDLQGHALMLNSDEPVFDFSALAQEHQDQRIESISLEGHGINTLNISAADVLAFGNEDLFLHDGSKQLMINGDAGDIVNLEALLPDGATASSWNNLGAITVGGVSYDVYHSDDQDVELLIQQGMQVNNNH